MRQIVYFSCVSSGHCNRNDIDRLVRMSGERNRASGITGLLAFDGRKFIQALEGPAEAVTTTMQRIISDRRHENIIRMSNRWIMERQFGQWSMAGRILTSAEDAEAFYRETSSYLDSISDPEIFAAFLGFASLSRAPFRNTPERTRRTPDCDFIATAPILSQGFSTDHKNLRGC